MAALSFKANQPFSVLIRLRQRWSAGKVGNPPPRRATPMPPTDVVISH